MYGRQSGSRRSGPSRLRLRTAVRWNVPCQSATSPLMLARLTAPLSWGNLAMMRCWASSHWRPSVWFSILSAGRYIPCVFSWHNRSASRIIPSMPINRRAFLGMTGAAAFAGRVQAPDTKSVKVEKDIVFGKGGQTDLRGDIYRPPAGTQKRMALIHIHGGGFARGSKDGMADQILP